MLAAHSKKKKKLGHSLTEESLCVLRGGRGDVKQTEPLQERGVPFTRGETKNTHVKNKCTLVLIHIPVALKMTELVFEQIVSRSFTDGLLKTENEHIY